MFEMNIVIIIIIIIIIRLPRSNGILIILGYYYYYHYYHCLDNILQALLLNLSQQRTISQIRRILTILITVNTHTRFRKFHILQYLSTNAISHAFFMQHCYVYLLFCLLSLLYRFIIYNNMYCILYLIVKSTLKVMRTSVEYEYIQ